ncbi:MAG: exosortase/archaeosortase family protein [Roseibacillus sp.]
MSATPTLERQDTRLPLAIVLGSAVLVMGYLYFVFGYSTGYMFERSTLWSNIRQGYRMEQSEWAFGYAVPPAVLILLWVTRARYAGLKPKSSWIGLAVLALACFIYFGGYKANEKYVGYGAGQLFVAGFILWFFGTEVFKRAFWLWVLFGLAWPLTFLIEPISSPLQLLMTKLTHVYLTFVGVDVIRSGTSLMSAPTADLLAGEKFSLGIAVACSGLRSLFALGMVSLLYGYISLKKGWHRFFLAAAAVPFAIFGNFIRMLLLYYGTIFFGKEFAIGESEHDPSGYHIGAGIMVFIVALICMLMLVQILNGGFKTLRRKKVRSRVVNAGADDDESADAPQSDSA